MRTAARRRGAGVRRAGSGRRVAEPFRPTPRPRRGRVVLSVLAMAAIAGMFLVTVVDPYAGATAQSFYQAPVLVRSAGVQRYQIDGGVVLIDPERDRFTVEDAATAAASGGGAAGASSGGAGHVTPVGVAQTYAARAVAKRGWAPSEFSCLVNLWNRESGWNTHAANTGSGAYGIPQALPGSKMATAGGDWQDSYETQIAWGLQYIAGSYGSPCGAWGHSNAVGWY